MAAPSHHNHRIAMAMALYWHVLIKRNCLYPIDGLIRVTCTPIGVQHATVWVARRRECLKYSLSQTHRRTCGRTPAGAGQLIW